MAKIKIKNREDIISGATRIIKQYGFTIMGSFGNVVTEEIAQKYGYSLKDIDQEGFKLIEGTLGTLDKIFEPLVTGELKDMGISKFTLDSENIELYLKSLKHKPIHINSQLDGHYNKDMTMKAVGSLLGGRIDAENGEQVIKYLGGLYDQTYPDEVDLIHNEKQNLGASFEITPTEVEIDGDSLIAKITSWLFKGVAIMKKDLAAFTDTSLLIAQSGKIPIERRNVMDKIFSQEDLDTRVSSILAESKLKWEQEVKTSETTKAKEKEFTDLKAQLETEKASVLAEQKRVADLVKEKKDLEDSILAEKKETEISAQAGEWFDKNKGYYEEKDKPSLIEARKSVIRGNATIDQIDSLATLRKKEESKSDLYASGREGIDTDKIDMLHGIRLRPKK